MVEDRTQDAVLVWLVVSVFVLSFAGMELFLIWYELQSVLGPEANQYSWGWEGGGWAYTSPSAYVTSLTIQSIFPIAWLVSLGCVRLSRRWFMVATMGWLSHWVLILLAAVL